MLSTHQKALAINLDEPRYGVFAEIGAAQEVARWFFHVGGAAGTVAESLSAYDKEVSDARYGQSGRYVSRERLGAMLLHEYDRLVTKLAGSRGDRSAFFVFADTLATRSYSRREEGEGWLGVRFQSEPGAEPSAVVLHVHLLDRVPSREQEAIGILGVNLLHGAFYQHVDPAALISSLMDDLSPERIEIDVIGFSGPAFAGLDERLMSLQLVEQGFTEAAMFSADGKIVQPSEVLYKRPILIERGDFRPMTKLTLDILESAREQFLAEPEVTAEPPVILLEMTLRSLTAGGAVDHRDFLARADTLQTLGYDVLISRFARYFALADYLSRYTQKLIGIALGLPSLPRIIEARDYGDLSGGTLEAAGRLFRDHVKVYVYPRREPASGKIIGLDDLVFSGPARHLKAFLVETEKLIPLRRFDSGYLAIDAEDVLARMQAGDPTWEGLVPSAVAETIKRKGLFGYAAAPSPQR
jgi:hypothetical protein